MFEASVYQGVSKGSAGYKLMAAMGWKEGDGLGANKQGIKEHVKVRKKSDSTGLGAHEAAARMRDWSLGMVNFENVLSSLKEVTSQHTSRSRGSDTSSESDAHEPPTKRNKVAKSSAKAGSSIETGGKQPAVAASSASPPPKHKKKVKFLEGASTQQQAPAPVAAKHTSKQVAGPAPTSSSASDLSSSASDSSAASSSSESEPEQPSIQPKRPTHLGRYRRRETGKMAAAYSATALAAILGAPATAAIKAEAKETVANASSSDSGAESDDEAEAPSAAPAARRIRPLHQEYTRLFQDADKEPQPLPPAAPAGVVPAEVASGPAGWWVKLFVRAGTMGSMKQEIAGPSGKQHIQVSGFREQDQEALYHQAHEGKTQNRQGLGRSDQIKVAGVRVSNKSVKLGSDDEEEAGERDQRAADAPEGPAPEEDSGRLVIVMPKRNAAAELGVAGAARVSPSGGEGSQQEGARRSKKKRRSELDDSAVDADRVVAADQVVVAGVAGKGRKDKKRKQGGNASDSMPPSSTTAQSDAGEQQNGETGKRKRSQAGEGAVVDGKASKKDRQKGDDESKKNKQRLPAPGGCTPAPDNTAKHSTVPPANVVVQPSTAAPTGKVSWCKVVSKVLKAQGGVMKVKKLQKAAIEAAGLAGHANGSSLVETLMAKLQRSDKFVVGPKRVELLQSAS